MEEEEEQEEESSEYETDCEDDDSGGPGVQLLKPVFVAKSKRVTLQEAADQAAKDEAKAKAAKAAAEARKQETRNLVAEQIRREDLEAASTLGAGQGGDEEGAGLPDDTDDLDDPVRAFFYHVYYCIYIFLKKLWFLCWGRRGQRGKIGMERAPN